jgi:hypothetical protein
MAQYTIDKPTTQTCYLPKAMKLQICLISNGLVVEEFKI